MENEERKTGNRGKGLSPVPRFPILVSRFPRARQRTSIIMPEAALDTVSTMLLPSSLFENA